MIRDHLSILYVLPKPASPPRYGGQVRMHGLMNALAIRHDLTAVSLVDPSEDVAQAREAMSAYCREVVLVPHARGATPASKRTLQLRSLASTRSYEDLLHASPAMQGAIDELLARRTYDVVNVEFPFLGSYRLHARAARGRAPLLVLDEHNVEYDIVRQTAAGGGGLIRRAYSALDWRKLRREELSTWRRFDGVTLTSELDERALQAAVPQARTAVVPNAVDVEHYRPRLGDPAADGRTLLFFGALNYFPNSEAILYFIREIWPLVAGRFPDARLKLVGQRPPDELLAQRGPRVEVTGYVDDLRPHIASAAVLIAPLRIGGGTRLKIVEAMAMAKPIVSTVRGAEGIDVTPERDILLADDPTAFATAIGRVLLDPGLGARLGASARALVEARYSWTAAGARLEGFLAELLAAPRATP